MGLAVIEEAGLAVPVADLKAYLRIDSGGEDMLLARLIRAASDLCERFIGQWLIVRAGEDVLPIESGAVRAGEWQRLDARPVVAIESVTGVPAEGAGFALPVGAYAIDIDRHGDGWVRVTAPASATRVKVRYRAGIAADAAAIPEGIRHGIVRMAAEMHGIREGDTATPPAAVTALWRPWRRMRLS